VVCEQRPAAVASGVLGADRTVVVALVPKAARDHRVGGPTDEDVGDVALEVVPATSRTVPAVCQEDDGPDESCGAWQEGSHQLDQPSAGPCSPRPLSRPTAAGTVASSSRCVSDVIIELL
jgi:hypothetical protein